MTFGKFNHSLSVIVLACIGCIGLAYSLSPNHKGFKGLDLIGPVVLQDTTDQDTVETPYEPTRRPTYKPKDRLGDPFSNQSSNSPLLLKDPSSLQMDVEIDTGLNYTIYEKIGDLNYRPTTSMSFEEFRQYEERRMIKDYWKNRSAGLDGESAVSGRSLIPPIYISPIFDRIFGGTYVEIIPRGFVTLDFGGRWQRINNPNIPIRQQRNGGFEFDQQISMNVTGKIGEKLQVTANFDNNNSFDFENNLKVEYTGFEEDILQKLEIGNVSLPLNNSLITGAQNLFGVKAQLQFGDLYVTTVASTQRGKSETIEIEGGGAQGREFEILASNYDENRHFFLGHFFRENYERWVAGVPFISSGVNVTNVEVYVVNRNNDTQTLRDVVGLMDLAEPNEDNIFRNQLINTSPGLTANANNANDLFGRLPEQSDNNRNSDRINDVLSGIGLEEGLDFEKITSARKLDFNEYSINTQLGYISLFRPLQNDEALAVSYQYSFNGQVFTVGELSRDYTNLEEEKVVFLKLLRPRQIRIDTEDPQNPSQEKRVPTWELMMKNIYSLNATNINPDGFQLRVIYRDDLTGIDNPQLQEGQITSTTPLIEVLGLDKLNPNNDPQRDGNFDFVEDITIDTETGLIIFPFLRPFGDALTQAFNAGNESEQRKQELIAKFSYDELYNETRIDAQLVSSKNKYILNGSFQSGSANEIIIPGFNIAEGSVRVFAGGSPLVEGTDYQVDYTFGKVNIINEGVLNSGKKITISYEKADLFNFQSRTLLGARFDYRVNDDINLGATILRLNERPLITRISVGNEPTRNTKYGFDVNINKESRFITKMLDKLPLLQTKEPSAINFNAEFAQLIPGTSNIVDGEGTSYIDDFENSATPFALNNPFTWRLASTPDEEYRPQFHGMGPRGQNDFRAKLAWYQVDNLFYRNDRRTPDAISDEELENHYVRAVAPQEIFPGLDPNIINFQQVFDLAYYPQERGQYNYTSQTSADGQFLTNNPRSNWGGITNAIRSEVDFDKANVEYIEFWLMDPFLENSNPGSRNVVIDDGIQSTPERGNTTGGDLYFNLGSISEDVIPDNQHGFENGLPPNGIATSPESVEQTDWGFVTVEPFLTNAFDNSEEARNNQDIGLDGLNNAGEREFFNSSFEDPSADDFTYFLGDELDQRGAGILERYKNFNGMENNSPVVSDETALFTPSGTTIPDNEDLNDDNTLSELEEYYEYKVDLDPGDLANNQYVAGQVSEERNGDNVTWYLFRIPIRQQEGRRAFGNISGFKSIRYLRMYLTDFQEPVVLRMANFRFVSSRWRRDPGRFEEANLTDSQDDDPIPEDFSVSVVNIEENSEGTADLSPYVVPPGFSRDRDNTSAVERRLNEQSLQICVDDIEDGQARAVVKQANLDLINYGRVKMFFHANSESQDGEMTAFLRMGTDVDSNYYEIEIPLEISPPASGDPAVVWPANNEIDLDINELYALKSERDRLNISKRLVFPQDSARAVGRHRIRLRGNPDLSAVEWLTIGVRNPRSPDRRPQSACVWANELRVTDFDRTKGWAANATLNAKLADFANVTATVRHTTFGFGGIQSRIAERTREETTSYDISANVTLDKLLPERLGLKVPMFVSYQKTTIRPNFDPANPDITLDAALLSRDEEEREEYEDIVTDTETRRSINFINVRKVKVKEDAKKHIYDIENFSFSYSFSELLQTNFNLQRFLRENQSGSVAYNYSPANEPWEPFKNSKWLDGKYLKLIKEFNFNPIPTNIGVRWDLNRQLVQRLYRNTNDGSLENFEKFFTFDRNYNIRWDLTQNLSVDYIARAEAIIDEPNSSPFGGRSQERVEPGEVPEFITREQYRDSVWSNLQRLGRMKNFNQSISANYKLPLDKIPITDWLSSDYRYQASYAWTAGPLYTDSIDIAQRDFGNTIQNSRDNTVSGKIDLVKLYNKVEFLKKINSPPRSTRRSSLRRNQQADTVKQKTSDNKAVKGLLKFLMSVRSINATYTLREGTMLTGFTPRVYLFGMDSSFNEPGLGFILGDQNPNIRNRLAEQGLISRNVNLTAPFTQTETETIDVRADLEPFKDFKIQLNAKKTKTSAFQEIFRYDTAGGFNDFRSFNPARSGAYNISFNMIRTAFQRDDDDNNSPVFEDFERNRLDILSRFRAIDPEYDTNSQDVLIPAFIAAYTGRDANDVNLSPFPRIPIPNWRIDYAGLGKIPALKETFQSISITHAYQSSYSVTNFNSNLEYTQGLELNTGLDEYNNSVFADPNNDLIPLYNISQVLISEQFAPLIGISVRTKKRLTAKVEYKTQRDIALNINNAQVTEVRSNDVVVEMGFTKDNFRLPFKSQGRVITLKNDLTFRMNFTIRDTETIQRRINEINTVTNGALNIQLRPNVSYVLNEKLNLQFYFERNINEPRISTSFRRATTRVGVQVRFSLAQ